MSCIYYFKSNSENTFTYRELVNYFILNVKDYTKDIVYSKKSTLELVFSDLMDLKEKSHSEVIIDSTGDTDFSSGATYTTQTFIDSNNYVVNGERPIYKLNDEDHLENLATSIELEDKVPRDLAILMALNLINNEKIIGEDAKEFHTLINSYNWFNADIATFIEHCKGTKFEGLATSIFNQMKSGDKSLMKIMYGRHNLNNSSAKIVTGLTLKADLFPIEGDISGHFDNIVVDSKGTLHIYNYKITSTPISEWGKVKKEKYKHELALKKLILAANGFDVRHVQLHIVPIRLKYDTNFENIQEIVFHNTDNIEFTVENNKYIFKKYDDISKYFIKSNIIFDKVSFALKDKINQQLATIFKERGVRHDGIVQTADEWIKLNYNSRIQLRIRTSLPSGYDVYFDDEMKNPIHVSSGEHPYKNQELKELVQLHIEELLDDSPIVMQRILKTIETSRTRGYSVFGSQSGRAFGRAGLHLGNILNKYFKFQEINNKKIYDWNLLEDDLLSEAGILLFQNRKTGQIDVITLSDYNLNVQTHFKGRNNIMGSYIPDNTKAGKLIEYPATFGNIEAVRTMTILNEVLPNIKSQDFELGQMIIVSSANRGQTKFYNIGEFNKNCFKECLKVVNHNNPSNQILSNFSDVKFIDPFKLVEQSLLNITDSNNLLFSTSEKENIKNLGFENIEMGESKSVKAQMILEIMNNMIKLPGCDFLKNSSAENIIKIANQNYGTESYIAKLYIDLSKALIYYKGITILDEKYISKFDKNGFVLRRVPNKTYRNIANLFTSAVNDVASLVLTLFAPVNSYLLSYYKSVGYSTLKNNILGNQASQFSNLYKRNLEGELMMEFRNPYLDHDEFGTLSSEEREVLKNALFTLAKYRCLVYGIDFNISGVDDPKLLKFIEEHNWYFNVPLMHASQSSMLQKGFKGVIDDWKYKAQLLLKKGNEVFNEFISGESNEDIKLYSEDFETLNLTNPFIKGDGVKDQNSRENYLLNHTPDYFEYDLSNILGHYITEYVKCNELNKTLLTAKASMIELELLGEGVGDSKGVKQTIEMIQDHIKLNVFQLSIMEEDELTLVKWLTPFKELVSKAYIAGNIVSMFRDTFEGMWLNTMRTLNHYLTDLNSKSVAGAYKEVVIGALLNIASVNKVDLLCKLYRLSNMDVYKIADSVSSSRTGIFNVENWMYATLRAPDFLNRMVLFTARCMQDGVWEAYSVENGQLIYNPKKDSRFKAYFEGNTSSEEYIKSKTAYYNAIRMYNQENPENLIGYNDILPQAYSKQQIEQMRQLSDSIYGAYDKSMRARYEHLALGWAFGTFSTWMNGIISNYMSKPGLYYDGETDLEQDTDDSGNKIWLKTDGTEVIEILNADGTSTFIDLSSKQQIAKDDSWVPAMKYVPRVVLGVYYTLKQIIPELRNGTFKENIWRDPMNRKNLLKFLTDALMWAIFYFLFKLALTPAYKNYKKDMKNNNIIANACVEILYKSTSRSYDGFGGMLNVILYLGENTNPPMYSLPILLTVDCFKTMFGDKTVMLLLHSDIAVFRTFLDTYKAELKKKK